LYLEGYIITDLPLIEKACRMARTNNLKIAIDFASFNVVEAYLNDFKFIVDKYVDIIFANEDEARAFTGQEPEKALSILSGACEIAVVKIGRGGSLIKRGDEVVKVPALDVDCNDTTGAGDLYASGFLYGLCMNKQLDKCGAFGTILAGSIIEVIGPKMDRNKWKAVRKMIDNIS
jgi:sugar/nucleoside kinase (ribokinase family)